MNQDSIYWTFSAAAQALAVVVAFLLAGYALMYGALESQVVDDESLREVTDELEYQYHVALTVLLSVAVLAVLSDLAVVWSNGAATWAPVWLQWLAGLATVISLLGAAMFVTWIVDPRRHKAAALRLLSGGKHQGGPPAPATEFFVEFQSIERDVRRLWQLRTDGLRLSSRPGPTPLREAIEVLRQMDVITEEMAQNLVFLTMSRNAIYHGEAEEIPTELVDFARTVREQLEGLMRSS